jgi:hypothetical protein
MQKRWKGEKSMPDIPIHNETDYTLSASILDQIQRDALEYFGDAVRAIRIQYGIDRHAFNARTGEMRYAFSPGDFGLVDMKIAFPEVQQPARLDIPSIDDEETEADEAPFEEVESEEDEAEPAFESLEEEEVDEVEEEDGDFQDLDDEYEEMDDDDKDYMYDDEEYE